MELFRDNEANNSKLMDHNMVKNLNWYEANQATTESKIQLMVRARLELGASRLKVQRSNHSTMLPPHYHYLPSKRKKMRWKKGKRRGGESQIKNKRSRLLCHLKFCFLHMLKLQKVKFYIWIARPQIVWPVNSCVWALIYRKTVQRKQLD